MKTLTMCKSCLNLPKISTCPTWLGVFIIWVLLHSPGRKKFSWGRVTCGCIAGKNNSDLSKCAPLRLWDLHYHHLFSLLGAQCTFALSKFHLDCQNVIIFAWGSAKTFQEEPPNSPHTLLGKFNDNLGMCGAGYVTTKEDTASLKM